MLWNSSAGTVMVGLLTGKGPTSCYILVRHSHLFQYSLVSTVTAFLLSFSPPLLFVVFYQWIYTAVHSTILELSMLSVGLYRLVNRSSKILNTTTDGTVTQKWLDQYMSTSNIVFSSLRHPMHHCSSLKVLSLSDKLLSCNNLIWRNIINKTFYLTTNSF